MKTPFLTFERQGDNTMCLTDFVFVKINVLFRLILVALILMSISCNKNTSVQPKTANCICGKFFAKGNLEYATYSFCSTMPQTIQYDYKKEQWMFWNKKGNLVANGKFYIEKQTIENHGGCSYEKLNARINKSEWRFWDELGNIIEPSEALIEQLESCSIVRPIYKDI